MAQDTSFQQTTTAVKGWWLGALGLGAAVAMTWLPHSYLRMVSWPWVLVWQVGFLALGVWLIWLLRQAQVPFRPLGYGLDWAVAATGMTLIICSLTSEFKTVALWNVVLVTCYVWALYCGVNWVSQARIKAIQMSIPIVGVVLGTALISLVLWRPGTEALPDNEFYAALRNAMPFGHHNFVGGYFALGLPFVLACALAWRGWRRWGAIATTILTGVALYVSGSRGALLGVLIWLLVAITAFVVGPAAKGRPRRLGLGGLGLGLIAVAVVSNPRVRSLIGSLGSANSSGFVVQDGPVLDRYFMAKTAVNILRDRPITGVGPGVMSRVSNLYRPIETGLGLDHAQQLHSTPSQLLGELGILGLVIYLLWLVLVTRLWLRLHHHRQDPADRWLLYGVGGSFLAYGVSSLTDYQLENIGISMLLIALLLILIGLAQQTDLPPPAPLGSATRRYLSLGLLAWLMITGYLWLMADLGFWFGDRALRQTEQGDVAGSLQSLASAAAFATWDPTYPALAGQDIYQLLPLVQPTEQEAVRRDALSNMLSTVNLAPNDAWFNSNLATLLLPEAPLAAGTYSQRAVQLLPRKGGFNRYLLGQTYLAQGQTAEAVVAFSLQGVDQPEFLTLPLWMQGPLAPLKEQVVDRALAHHEAVLAAMSPAAPGYATFYDQMTLVRWWHRRPLLAPAPDLLRPITQALLSTDQGTEAALVMINQALRDTPQDQGLLLLRAWLVPEQFAQAYFEQADLAPADQQQLAASMMQHREVRSWLTSLKVPAPLTGRSLLGLTYRNRYAQGINFIAPLEELEQWVIPEQLGLFGELPREFVALDQTLESIQTEQLNLPSAVHNHFEIVPQPPLPEKLF